jgi:tetratricopeptide (TPR) repeat protein
MAAAVGVLAMESGDLHDSERTVGKNQAMPLTGILLVGLLWQPAQVSQNDRNTRTLAQISREADDAIVAGDFGAAVALIEKGLRIDPEWKDGLWKAGLVLYQNNQFEPARGYLNRLTQVEPTRGVAWALLGMCEFQRHEFQAAIEDIARADRLGIPELSGMRRVALLDRAIAQTDLSNFGTGVALLAKLVPAESPEERDQLITVFGYASLQRSTDASLSPLQTALVHDLGAVQYANASGDRSGAKSLIEGLLLRYPREPMLHFTYGSLLVSWREYDAAVKEFGAELALNLSSLSTRLALASLGLTLGKISEALPYAIEASKMRPDSYLAHLYLGRLLIRAGQLNEGCKELEIARGLSPSNSEVRYVLATTYRRLGRAEDAQREYKEFERLKALDK